jgi:hypothetical protein
MRPRLVLAATALAAVGLVAPNALAAPTPTMDGKKVKELVLKANGGANSHDTDLVTSVKTPVDRYNCPATRCATLKFVYKPAKGVKDGLLFSLKWTNPASDLDLFVGQVGKNGDVSEVAACGGAGTASEQVYLSAAELKPGKTYVLIADFYRSLNENVTGKVAFGANTMKTTVPGQVDDNPIGIPFNCSL